MTIQPSLNHSTNDSDAALARFQSLEEFQRRYFPRDFQINTRVDSSEAVLHQITEESAGMIRAAFAESR
jgi:hypothetical protein